MLEDIDLIKETPVSKTLLEAVGLSEPSKYPKPTQINTDRKIPPRKVIYNNLYVIGICSV